MSLSFKEWFEAADVVYDDSEAAAESPRMSGGRSTHLTSMLASLRSLKEAHDEGLIDDREYAGQFRFLVYSQNPPRQRPLTSFIITRKF